MDTSTATTIIAVFTAMAGAIAKLYVDNRKLNRQVSTILERELKNTKETERRSSSLLKTITDQQKAVYDRTIPNPEQGK